MELINYYRNMVHERDLVILRTAAHFKVEAEEVRRVIAPLYWSLAMATLPKGLDLEDSIEIHVTSLEGDR